MMPSRLRPAAGLASCLLVAACGGNSEKTSAALAPLREAARGDNVLLISLDTTRADRLGCYGYTRGATPNLDRFAAEGVLVERALAPAPITLPSHASLLSGLLPIDLGVRDNGIFKLDDSCVTLAERFAAAGYATAAFVSAYPVTSVYGLAQGFDFFEDALGTLQTGAVQQVERKAGETVSRFLEWLEQAPPEPWFLWLHFFDPHRPFDAPEPFAARFSDPYDAEIAYLDQELGRLLEAYGRDGRLERTVAIITADHGEGMGEHGETSHGLFVYDSTMRVPLLLRHPALGRGKRLRGQVGLVDIAPTLLDLLSPGLPAELAGHSLLPALTSAEPEAWHDVYLETQLTFFSYGLAPLEAVADRRFKYVAAPRAELYAWPEDPGELRDLVTAQPAEVERLRRRLAELRGGREPFAATPNRTLDEEERAQLLALGYLEMALGEEQALADPKDALPQLMRRNRAVELLSQQHYAEAEQELLALTKEAPGDAGAFGMLGHVLLRQNKVEPAIEALQRSLSLRPDQTGAALDLARAWRQRREFAKALAAYEQLLRHSPSYADAHLQASFLCRRLQQWERAIRHLEQAVELFQREGRDSSKLESDLAALRERLGG